MLRREWLDGVVAEFVSTIEFDERQGVGTSVREAEVNALLASVDDPDPTDVAEAIWECIPNAKDVLAEDLAVDLLDIVDRRWDDARVSR
jgi:hypothetical protein